VKAALALLATALAAAPIAAAPAPARPAITSVSHLAIYSADPAKTERFYMHDLGATRGPDPENPAGVRYYFSPTQFVEVLALPPGAGIARMDHAAFNVTDAEAMRRYLAANRIAVPAAVTNGRDGSRWFQVTDPEGTRIEFVQPSAHPEPVPTNPLSSQIIHVGFIVHDRAREDGFYQRLLGFRPYWAGGMTETNPSWISLQLPDSRDWLEYMVVGTPEGHGPPPGMTQATLGVLDHFALGIPNAEAAYTRLWTGARLDGQNELPKIGRDAKWQLNMIDPDGTRAELMELHAIGKPCCSPFTQPDPTK
jgi:catechol 2,3-dioxygenase-like lactoylglutathione lyase family enzyme